MARETDLDDVICCLRRRAKKAQWSAWLSFLSAFVIAITTMAVVVVVFSRIMDLSFFSETEAFGYTDYYDPGYYEYQLPKGLTLKQSEVLDKYVRLQIRLSNIKTSLDYAKEEEASLSRNSQSDSNYIMRRKLDGEMKNIRIIMFSSLVGFASLSSLALCLYVLQFLIGLTQYFLRLSRHLEIVSDVAFLSGLRDHDKVTRLINVYASNSN